jgi:hypothetical protein
MGTEHNSYPAGNGPVHQDVAFDPRDVRSRSVLHFLFYLALTVVVALLVCWGVLKLTSARIARFEPAPTPVRQDVGKQYPPEPRLQGIPGDPNYHPTDPQQDLRDKLARDRAALEDLRWVDEKAGIAQIPIEEAMKIIAERGLPARPGPAGAHAVKPVEGKRP